MNNQISGRVEFVLQINCDLASLVQPNSIPILLAVGSWSDHDSGGFVISDLAHNLRLCMAEKKISKVVSRYPEWWLALDDRIGYGDLDEDDRNQLRRLVRLDHPWSKIILVNPLSPSNGLEM